MTRQALQAATPVGVLAALADALGLERRGSALVCPVHDDRDASAGIFPVPPSDYYGSPAHGRWKCHACGAGGDALELVMRARPDWNNAEAERWLWQVVENLPADHSSPPDRPPFPEAWVRRGLALPARSQRVAAAFFSDKGMDVDAAWAVETWRLAVGVNRGRADELLMPWFANPGGEEGGGGALVGATKRTRNSRTLAWAKRSLDGSQRADVFYGEWRDQGRRWVVLAEGETDALALAWWLRMRAVDVLGVAGAGQALTPGMAARLAGRSVVFVPDQDQGAEPSAAWAQAWGAGLARADPRARCRVLVARLPRGADAASAGRRDALAALRRAAHE